MGIQINGQTDTISAGDGGLNINNTGITTAHNVVANDLTANDLTINNITGVAATFTGVLTYEDVTNIDSVGLVTARSGVNVTGGEITVGVAFSVGQAGVVTATSFVGDGSNLSGVGGENDITSSLFT